MAELRVLSLLLSSTPDARTRFASHASWLLLLSLLRARAATWLSSAARARIERFEFARGDATALARAAAAYALTVVALMPADAVFNAAVRSVRAEWSHLLAGMLAERVVGRQAPATIKSPESIVSESADKFVDLVLTLAIEAAEGVTHLLVFGKLLQDVSPALLKWIVATSVFGTAASLLVGRNLPALFRAERVAESELLFHLTRTREHAESIQFYGGRDAEVARAEELDAEKQAAAMRRKSAKDAVDLFSAVLRRVAGGVVPFLVLGSATQAETDHSHDNHNHSHSHSHSHGVHAQHTHAPLSPAKPPSSTASTASTASSVATLVQATEAFDEVLFHLLVVSENAHDLSRLQTTSTEICELVDAYSAPSAGGSAETASAGVTLTKQNNDATWMAATKLSVKLPGSDGPTLVRDLDFSLAMGESLLLTGPSGCGKTALLRVLCGLWTHGSGSAVRPLDEDVMFLPQRPYCAGGSLREEVWYPRRVPANTTPADDERVAAALQVVGLGHLLTRSTAGKSGLSRVARWPDELSVGEQQRLAFARLVLHKPRFAVLDEATSAVDVQSESKLYEVLTDVCVGGFVSVGHRKSIERFHLKKIVLGVADAEAKDNAGWVVEF